MVKYRTFKKTKPSEPIPITAWQLESFILEHNGRFTSRDYDKLERMELMESPIHDAKNYLCTYMKTLIETKKEYVLTVTPEKIDTFLKILKNSRKVSAQ